MLFSETCVSMLFIAAIESERSGGRGQFLSDVRHLNTLTWQEHARRLLESKGATLLVDSGRRRAGCLDPETDSDIEEMFAQLSSRDFFMMDVDCKVALLRCLFLFCAQPGLSIRNIELQSNTFEPRPKRQAAKSFLAGIDASAACDRDLKRRRCGHDISQVIDSSAMLTAATMGRGSPLGVDRHGNRYYHFASDPSRVYCESFNKMFWMVYETESQISSLFTYLHPNGLEEQSLIQALVFRLPQISAAVTIRSSVRSQSSHRGKSSQLKVPLWASDSESFFVAQQLISISTHSPISLCVPSGVGNSNLKPNQSISAGVSEAASLFSSLQARVERDSLHDLDDNAAVRHWLPAFIRRRRFSNRTRLYQNCLHHSGYRSLCLQAHPVNRLLLPLTSADSSKRCLEQLIAECNGCRDELAAASMMRAESADPSKFPSSSYLDLQDREQYFDQMPGVYHPLLHLKAHAILLSKTIFSILKPSFEGLKPKW
jgi:hypothetical protein